jgi:hypothetical protein
MLNLVALVAKTGSKIDLLGRHEFFLFVVCSERFSNFHRRRSGEFAFCIASYAEQYLSGGRPRS